MAPETGLIDVDGSFDLRQSERGGAATLSGVPASEGEDQWSAEVLRF